MRSIHIPIYIPWRQESILFSDPARRRSFVVHIVEFRPVDVPARQPG
jgi:hypothetical protein